MTTKETEMQNRIDKLEDEIASININYRLLEKIVIKLSDDMRKLNENNLPLLNKGGKLTIMEVSR